MEEKILFADTTLRDGAQSPGIYFADDERLEIFKLLQSCGVDIIEAGIPVMGVCEQRILCKMKECCTHSKLLVWNRVVLSDIEDSIACYPDIIHISVPVSNRQMDFKLGKSPQQVMKAMQECAYKAKCAGHEISIGFEDASRTETNFLFKLLEALEEFHPQQIRYADTVGILTPQDTYEKIDDLQKGCPYKIEFHGHNDLGFGIANTLAAIQAGASIVDTTFLGIGERAGNCDFVKLLKVLNDSYSTNILLEDAIEAQKVFEKYIHKEWW